MSIQKNKPEQIVTVLRQIEVQIANGKKVPQACKEAGIHTQTYYRWRKEYGGRLCQVNGAEARFSRKRMEFCNCSTGARHLFPIGKSPGAEESMMVRFQMMTTNSEQVLNGAVD